MTEVYICNLFLSIQVPSMCIYTLMLNALTNITVICQCIQQNELETESVAPNIILHVA